ncbi:protoheme IX farnesyltransferase, partial [Mesorhizobium sp. M5C.F.Ca.IN.020.29.1.1]
VYTMWLKRWTPQNIVIGGAAGAIPPVIGWAAVTGTVSLESVVLFLIIFLWTPPHFWALALFKSEDYARAGIPMMPNVAGQASTRRQIFAYALILAPVGVLPSALGFTTPAYGVFAVLLGAGFVWYAWKVLQMADDDHVMKPAKALFGYSLLYLFAIFAIYLADCVVARVLAMGGA